MGFFFSFSLSYQENVTSRLESSQPLTDRKWICFFCPILSSQMRTKYFLVLKIGKMLLISKTFVWKDDHHGPLMDFASRFH